MRKVILGAAALMIGTMSYAQNISDLDQSGTNNADIDQTSTGIYYNDSDVDQDGSGNDAQVTQVGQNDSTVDQMGTGNMADINQDGGNQPVNYDSVNTSTAIQNGTGNVVDVDQVAASGNAASANMSQINQDNSATNGDGNYAKVLQGAFSNQSTITQMNDDNSADIDQAGAAHVSVTNQTSDGAITASGAGYAQTSTVLQRGRRNFSSVSQNGDVNSSSVDQQSSASFGVAGLESNRAVIGQSGYNNSSVTMQSDLVGNDGNNTLTVMQSNSDVAGLGNISTETQMGANTATVTQSN
ncbi:MAG: hypothetical protein ACSHW7_10050 [Patiriisocius sp.]|uniref:hypothetical protein n=1 Tax=Patiriisocius sp. TaxID=2822396 RepID=UPI003EF36CCC